jgi:hypothetical protein
MLQRFAMSGATTKNTSFPVGISLSKTGGNELPPDNQYQALVGSLIYLAVNTRPVISHAVGVLSRFMPCPTDKHWGAAKHVLRCLRGTPDLGLTYSGNTPSEQQEVFEAAVYADADFAADVEAQKHDRGCNDYAGSSCPLNHKVTSYSCNINCSGIHCICHSNQRGFMGSQIAGGYLWKGCHFESQGR